MAGHRRLSRASRLVAAGLAAALAGAGLHVAGAAPPSTPPTAPAPPPSPTNPLTGTTAPAAESTTTTAPPKPMAPDRSHAVFAPDGCPTTPPENTLRGTAGGKSLYQICADSVRGARSPQAALAIRFALSELGAPYSQAQRNSPGIYDCSSFVSRAYQAAGVPIAYPETPGRIDGGPGQNTPGSRAELAAPWSLPVAAPDAKPGDLLFFPGADPPNGHVGMLLAHGLYVHTNAHGDVAHVKTLAADRVSAYSGVDPAKATGQGDRDATALAHSVQKARERYEAASRDVVRIQRDLAKAHKDREAVAEDLQAARDKQTVASRRREAARRRLQRVAVVAYMHGGMPSNILMLLTTSIDELGRDQALLSAVGDKLRRLITAYERARDAAVREERELQARLDAIDGRIRDLQAAESDAQSALTSARSDPATPILGPAQLTAAELAAWYRSTGEREGTTVPVDVLARLFIEEGKRAGVRGDVAFAQAAFDTGNFTFPAIGALAGNDKGMNLIGGCDSCQDIPWYGTAREAVRAQVQLLRAFADADVTPANLGEAPVVPGMLEVHTKGKIQSWSQLPGMSLHTPMYGTAIVVHYTTIATWVTEHPIPDPKPKPAAKPKSGKPKVARTTSHHVQPRWRALDAASPR
jgi:cell wall-associated NlpC family hydrolase